MWRDRLARFWETDTWFVVLLVLAITFVVRDVRTPAPTLGQPCGPGGIWQITGDQFRGIDLSCEPVKYPRR